MKADNKVTNTKVSFISIVIKIFFSENGLNIMIYDKYINPIIINNEVCNKG